MKTYTIIYLFITLMLAGFIPAAQASTAESVPDSVAMGPGYANDIYYSFEDGIVASVSRTNWDIGFQTSLWTASITTNGGNGVNLYTYPNSDTTGWATIDTIGLATWPKMYDNEDLWDDGAFTRNSTGHPDYGWGNYNPITHDVVGDSIYILQTPDGMWRKIWIIRKNSSNNMYFIRIAELDGTNDHVLELDINPYTNKNFVYYSLASETFINREPDTNKWDIQFTKYMAIQPDGTPYPVVGVYNNMEVYANKFYPVGPDFTDYLSMPFDSTKSPIGWEWKSFSMTTGWSVSDSTAFFVHTHKGNVYKLVFTKFEGSSTGKIVFNKENLTSSSIFENKKAEELTVYPNPVKDQLTIDFGRQINGKVNLAIFDNSGRQVFATSENINNNHLTVNLPESCVSTGLHVMKVVTEDGVFTSKFMTYSK